MWEPLLPTHLKLPLDKLLFDWRRDSREICPVRLRYPSEVLERAFMEERKGKLVLASLLCAGLVGALAAGDALAVLVDSDWELETDVAFVVRILWAFISACTFLTLLSGSAVQHIRAEWLELFWGVMVSSLLLFFALAPSDQLPGSLEGHPHLAIAATLSLVHLCLTIRWYVIYPAGVLAAMLAAWFDEEAPEALFSFAIVVAGMFHLRSIEYARRVIFLLMEPRRSVNESITASGPPMFEDGSRLRSPADEGCQSKQASMLGSCHGSWGRTSVHSTNSSGRLFTALYDMQVDPQEGLRRLSHLGRLEQWSIEAHQVQILVEKPLGSGGFGKVMRGVWHGMLVAVKVPSTKICTCKADLKILPSLANELRILRHIRHPNLVMLHGAIIEPEELTIGLVLELVDGVTLDAFLDDVVKPGALHRYQLMLGIASGLVYLHTHEPQIAHGDLKPMNILVERRADGVQPRILDFGLSRVVSKKSPPFGGTLGWMAPEVALQGPVRCSADVYTYGCLMGYIAAGICLVTSCTRSTLKRALRTGNPVVLPWPAECVFTPRFRPLALECMESEEHQRPCMVQVQKQLLFLHEHLDLGQAPMSFLRPVQTLAAVYEQEEKESIGSAPFASPGIHLASHIDDLESVGSEARLPPSEKMNSVVTKGIFKRAVAILSL